MCETAAHDTCYDQFASTSLEAPNLKISENVLEEASHRNPMTCCSSYTTKKNQNPNGVAPIVGSFSAKEPRQSQMWFE